MNDEQAKLLRVNMKSIWENYFLPADIDFDSSVTANELIAYMREALKDESKRNAINATLPLVFEAIDANHDGGISPVEFHNYFLSLGCADEIFTKKVFDAMDVNGDGDLSCEGESIFFY